MSEREATKKLALEKLAWMHEVVGITITEIAERMDTTAPVVSRWYNGKVTPNYGTARRILRLAEVVAATHPKAAMAA